MRGATLLMLAACGRIHFSPTDHDAAGDLLGDVSSDGIDQVGCSDGMRDGYADLAGYPTIAACAASWAGNQDLRALPTGVPCGDDLGVCGVPSDACSPGWHVCARSGDVVELLVLGAPECQALLGKYVAAVGHCVSNSPCTYPMPGNYPCLGGMAIDCTQPVCCGTGCDTTTSCKSGVWPGETGDNETDGPGCATTPSTSQDGVLCCKT